MPGLGGRLEQAMARARNVDEALARVVRIAPGVDESGARECRHLLRNRLLADVLGNGERGGGGWAAIAQSFEDREVRDGQLLGTIGPSVAEAVAQAFDDDGEADGHGIGSANRRHAAM